MIKFFDGIEYITYFYLGVSRIYYTF